MKKFSDLRLNDLVYLYYITNDKQINKEESEVRIGNIRYDNIINYYIIPLVSNGALLNYFYVRDMGKSIDFDGGSILVSDNNLNTYIEKWILEN